MGKKKAELKSNIGTSVIDGIALELLSIREQIKILESKEKSVKLEINAMLEELETATLSGDKFSINCVEQQRSDLDKIKLAAILNEDVLKACYNVKSFTKLIVTKR